MRLLIAEDELDLAEALTVFFERNHFTVDAVHNGADAYDYGVSGEYDAIILDVMMPKMNGIQVLERLRAEGVKTPIMMLTAKGQRRTALPASTPVRTTTCPSPSTLTSLSPGCGPCSAAARATSRPCWPAAI